MKIRVVAPLALAVLAVCSWWCWDAFAQTPPTVHWIWFDEGDPLSDAPAEIRYFRRVFTVDVPKAGEEALLEITADNGFIVWLNGVEVGTGNTWERIERYEVGKRLVAGKNILAVEARNEGGPAGLLVRLSIGPKGKGKTVLVSNREWKSSKTAAKDWKKLDFDDSKWSRARELVPMGGGPWAGASGSTARGGPPRFVVPEDFIVEQAVAIPESDRNFSLVNMTFDARGRLLVSREGGPVLLCTDPDAKQVCQTVRPYCKQVTNCQGMCWVDDALFLVGNGPQGTGLYRCRDTKKADEIDKVELLHRFDGGMGEHGPHAVLQGPDGWIYFVIGNHAHARVGKGDAPNPAALAANSPLRRWPTGRMGPDQGKPRSTEDVLLPRQNDANGHAANLLAPGGTIWRVDRNGQNISLVAAGFRNEFDAAFSPVGELFTFDSDMEWDEGLPWYRPVRICHCPPGAELGWRTGSSKIPPYAIDTLPAIYDTGRGSPVGLEFYDHQTYPERYRAAYFMADWSLGIIWGVHLSREGASYKAQVEKFCTGAPMPVTDLAVAPDGNLWFTVGGRGTQGGVYRIVPKSAAPVSSKDILDTPQPLAAWSRAQWMPKVAEEAKAAELEKAAVDSKQTPARRVKAITMLAGSGQGLKVETVCRLIGDRDADVRAQAVWALGINRGEYGKAALVHALHDSDAFVKRRACEALIRRGFVPAVGDVWPLLGENDRFLRTAARLVLERIDPAKWTERLWGESKDSQLAVLEGIIALCKIDEAAPYTEKIFARLRGMSPGDSAEMQLAWLRTTQLALFHTSDRPASLRDIAERCAKGFPATDTRISREQAILLTWFRKEKILDGPVHTRLLEALEASAKDRPQQIHYFYCLRLLKDGWTPEEKARLLAWYDGTKTWSGGASYTGFLENILRDASGIFTAEDAARIIAHGETMPRAASALLRILPETQLPLVGDLAALHGRLMKAGGGQSNELKAAVVTALGKVSAPEAQTALRRIADSDPSQRETVVRSLLLAPTAENFAYLVRGLDSPNKVLLFDLIEALRKAPVRPKADEPAPYRSLLLASGRLDTGNRWKAVLLLRHWSGGRQFGADDGDWQTELAAWSRWFGQSFPKEPALPDIASDRPPESKYKFDELLAYLQGPARSGDAVKGRVVFEKAQCMKCHKYGKEGEGIGPDLTTLSKRFKRGEVLESILYPSKVISDQYRSSLIVTKKGLQLSGLVAVNGDRITVLMSDGSKVALKKEEIEQQYASLVSVMPERLLDPLSKTEIADLFAFLESDPAK
jgi:putative heme-binding domain-containing protein